MRWGRGRLPQEIARFWSDADRDGVGADGEGSLSCQQPPDTADRDGDCDDTDPDINPDADEICDEHNTDEDCDDRADDADTSTLRESMQTWHVERERDRDGFGDPERMVLACDLAPGRTTDDTDCDDEDAALNPELGCPGPWDGDWDTTLVLEVTLTIYEEQYGGTEYPARLDHLMLRDTQAAVWVQASQVVFTERHDLGVGEPIEWSDHSGVQASLLIEP